MPEVGQTISHYKILEKIGVGGMGEVYLADDLSLDRKVALKFLPEVFTGDPERMARFEREAKLLASLNHPNIAAIYGLEQADGKRFLIMEYVAGETLQSRISKGALPLEDALAVCRQIAEGLEAAHEKGVIHRDLKPANVMITGEEKVKILDFGLAKALADEIQSVDSSQSPTITEAMTQPGVVLGTAAYMSPEQAKGKAVDKRADIWAFGCILYECLTGKKVFGGERVTEALAAVIRGEPDWDELPESTPKNIRFVLQRCLEKEKGRRLRDVADLRILIDEPIALPVVPEAAHGAISKVFGATLIIAGLVVGWAITYSWHLSKSRSAPEASSTISYITAPDEVVSAFSKGFTLSPDGKTLIFSARTGDGTRQLWKQQLDQPHAFPIAGTDEGHHPFWSPDGQHIAFFTQGELRRIPADGGNIRTICTTPAGTNIGSWSDNNDVLFSVNQGSRIVIFRVPADSGTPLPVSDLGDESVICPHWLPGGQLFLFSRYEGDYSASIFAASIDGTITPKRIVELDAGFGSVDPLFFFDSRGYLFFNKAGALNVQQFDPQTLSVTGKPVAIAGLVGTPNTWFALAAANNRVMMFSQKSRDDTGNPGDPIATLKWLNRQGEEIGTLGPPRRYWTLRLSPDGLSAAANPDTDIWIIDASDRVTRVTLNPENDAFPVWSPEGERIAFGNDLPSLRIKPAAQGGDEIELINDSAYFPTDWSRDGKYLLLTSRPTEESPDLDIYLYDLEKKSVEPWLDTKANEDFARFSPDGKWVAYSSDVTGPYEVYLCPFSKDRKAFPVSSGGGMHPVWLHNGNELYYLSPNDEVMAVNVSNLDAMNEVDEPKSLFEAKINDISSIFTSPYDVHPDGDRFLVNVPEAPEPLLFIQGFGELLRRGQ